MAGLWFGSEILIRGATALTDRYRLSDAAFGMLVLAIGTDLPELFVAFEASVRSLDGADFSGIVIGSAVGSSIGQFALVFGVGGFIGYEAMRRRYLSRNAIFLLGSIAALFAFSYDGEVSRVEGGLLMACYAAYLCIMISQRTRSPDSVVIPLGIDPPVRAWVLLAGGLILLLLAAEATVASAIGFAREVGLSDIAVSAIVIGMGSSLPEMSISLAALLRKRGHLSAGNLVGSNVLDTLLVPGLAAAISPLAVATGVLMIDLPFLLLVTAMVLVFLYVTRRGVHKPEAIALLAVYVAYVFVRLTGPGS